MRGRVLSGSCVAIGVAVLGPIMLGALSDAAGMQGAIAASLTLLSIAGITVAI